MKKTVLTMMAAVAMFFGVNAFAQDQQAEAPQRGDRGAGWMEKMKSARVAFLTTELDLSAQEAEAFWPIYNQAQEEKDAAFRETRTAYKALNDAIKEGKSDKEVGNLLKAYLKASKVPAQLDDEYLPEYLKVLSATKVAKLYISEEKFRKMQFQNFQGPGRGPGQGGPGQGGPGFRGGQGGPGQGGSGFRGGQGGSGQREGFRGQGGQGAPRGRRPQTTETL